MNKLIWCKSQLKGQLANWRCINFPEYNIQAVDGYPLQEYLYSVTKGSKHLCSASTLELAQQTCENELTAAT